MTTKVKGSVFDLIKYGSGSPEGVLVGDLGDLYINTDGGANLTLWVKEADDGLNTGWAAK